MLKPQLIVCWALRIVKGFYKQLAKVLFHSQVNGLIAIGDSKSDTDCVPAMKVCAFPCINSKNYEKADHMKHIKKWFLEEIIHDWVPLSLEKKPYSTTCSLVVILAENFSHKYKSNSLYLDTLTIKLVGSFIVSVPKYEILSLYSCKNLSFWLQRFDLSRLDRKE